MNQSIAGTNNARLIDYLQICKIQTHMYAINKIRSEYKNVYIQRAKAVWKQPVHKKEHTKLPKDISEMKMLNIIRQL